MKNCSQITLVTGAASSGKSEWAEYLAAQTGKPIAYVATAQYLAEDPEWSLKIAKHRQRRPSDWQTWEVPLDLADAILKAGAQTCLLVDSLGTWVANFLPEGEEKWNSLARELLASLATSKAEVIFVAEETGWGIVPAYESGRIFRDRLGKLSRTIGAQARRVYLVTGGHALEISSLGEKVGPVTWYN